MRSVLLFSIIFFLALRSYSDEVKFSGNAITYAGEELVFYTWKDLITYTEAELCRFIVQENGDFSCTFDIDEIKYCYSYLGVYKGSLFIEPGKEYELVLPDKKEKAPEDLVNMYFQETELYLGIDNSDKDELNYNIRLFDGYYEDLMRSSLVTSSNKKARLDSTIYLLDSVFSIYQHDYYNAYVDYRLAIVRYVAYQRKFNFAVREYFLNKPILFNNVSYMEFYNQLFDKFFISYSQTNDGERIFEDIAKSKSPYALKQTLHNNLVLQNEELKEFIIIKALHDAFYDDKVGLYDKLPKKQLLQTLDSMVILSSKPEWKQIARNIHKKVTWLTSGSPAPEFSLYDKNDNLVSLKNFKGNYVYLGFYTMNSFTCKQDIEALKVLKQKHGKAYEIITILIDDNFQESVKLMEENGCHWTILHVGNQPEIIRKYNVKAYPTYYFLDKKGKLGMSPAPSPSEGFEESFFRYIKANR